MTRSPDMLDQSLAHEIEEARKLLEVMGDELAADIDIITKHCTSLQTIDIVMQILGHIANVVRSDDRRDAVDAIGMHDLKMKLLPAAIDAARKAAACERAA
ncbi:hypothetical protein [Sphingomicrobium astaxanthinifaciens]|uniref:hypothetical protein n=1 Tax=Sphingomicrobium astaxanthinifaciens TaxID=1227949 RepID=UPI001FCA538F|nr:hypothetical protein [Sphingomicrobium astaxanthinifaciens]MCJ7420771.1 hypothetical protein [Sphingomicrobium astaxanthinifaciens]